MEWYWLLSVRGITLEQGRALVHDKTSIEKVDKWSVIRWLIEWHGT